MTLQIMNCDGGGERLERFLPSSLYLPSRFELIPPCSYSMDFITMPNWNLSYDSVPALLLLSIETDGAYLVPMVRAAGIGTLRSQQDFRIEISAK